jgi:ATP-dependent Lon protease
MFDNKTYSIDPEYAAEKLKISHPWVAQWVVRVSKGLFNVVDDLLTNIEEVMYSSQPDLIYFWITEDVGTIDINNIDLSDLYRRRLQIFVQAKKSITARDRALEYVIEKATTASMGVCIHCGGPLEIKSLKSISQREKFPFLPKLPEIQPPQTGTTSISICMPCAQKKWEDEWSDEDELDDPFAGIPEEDEFLDSGEYKSVEGALMDMASKIKKAAENSHDLFIQPEPANEDPVEQPAMQKQVAVFSVAEVDKLEADYKDSIKDHATRVKGLVKKLRATPPNKDLILIPDAWRNYCDDIEAKFPNFKEVVGFLRTQIALSCAGDCVLRLPPFLLLGDPGIGKTEFALTIASDFKTRLEVIDIASAQSGVTLSGSEAYWSTTQPGAIFNSLVFSQHANPLILLDELDKARNDEHYNALAVLHQVLEPRQAKMYRDLSVPELTIDASHIIWIGTANKADLIEKPILDRFVCFNVEPPSKTQMPAIVMSQYQRFIVTHPSGKVFDETMRDDVLDELCKHHPRKVRKMLNQAFGLAAIAERKYLTVEDIRASESEDKKKNSIGFAAEIN